MSVSMKNIVLFVSDLNKAKTFYAELLGLPLAGESQMMMEFFPGAKTTLGISLALNDDARKMAVVADPDGNQLALVEMPR
ncbi:MAG: VOC family protein [Deltaproteobacteria bacterium]|nr:VOC family protein [Deltaproteobacteria bacterium]